MRVAALILAALFLPAAAAAWFQIFSEGNFLANPKLKPAAAWLVSGALFLAIGLRGWRLRP